MDNEAVHQRGADDVISLSSGSSSSSAAAARHQQQQQYGEGEPPEKLFFKTKLCDKFMSCGNCPYGVNCTFAHGQVELRPPVQDWEAKQRAHQHHQARRSTVHGNLGGFQGRVCFQFREKGTCDYGDRCNFFHASPEMHHHLGEPMPYEAKRNAAAPARAFPLEPAAAAAARIHGNAAAPARAFPPVPAPAAAHNSRNMVYDHHPQQQQQQPAWPGEPVAVAPDDGQAKGRIFLVRRKLSGIYADWPED